MLFVDAMTDVGWLIFMDDGGGGDTPYEMRVADVDDDGGDIDGSREYDGQYSGSDLIDAADCGGNDIGGDSDNGRCV